MDAETKPAWTKAPEAGDESLRGLFVAGRRSGRTAGVLRIGVLTAVMTLFLCGLVYYERAAAVREALASETVLRFAPSTGVAAVRREAGVQLRKTGRELSCWYDSSTGDRLVCPPGFGAIAGACAEGATGDLLVTWEGTGWRCPAPRSGDGNRSVSVLCCK